VKQYVQTAPKRLVGVDAKTGKLLWRYAKAVSRYAQTFPHPLPPVVTSTSARPDGGGVLKAEGQRRGVEAEQVYFESKLPTSIGGVVKVGNHLYGTTGQSLLVHRTGHGAVKWEDRALARRRFATPTGGCIFTAENGDVALWKPRPSRYREKDVSRRRPAETHPPDGEGVGLSRGCERTALHPRPRLICGVTTSGSLAVRRRDPPSSLCWFLDPGCMDHVTGWQRRLSLTSTACEQQLVCLFRIEHEFANGKLVCRASQNSTP